jgi:hypothetical protein
MEDEDIRFASAFLCPFPCRTEVEVVESGVAKCQACGKEFDQAEVIELLLSQGRFFLVEECDTLDVH